MAKQVPSLTEWRIIGVSGATADGREISASELKEMAETYDPEIYTAKINLEHFRFLYDSWEGAYGDVRELKAEPWAKDPSKTALLAKFSVLPALQNVWDKGSKVFTSMEIQSNFAKTGKAYLVGVAITDSPASLGTTQNYSMVQTKLAEDMKLSEYKELEMQLENKKPENPVEDKPITESTFANLLNKFFAKSDEKAADKQPETPPKPVEPESESQNYAQQIAELVQANQDQAKLFERLLTEHQNLQNEFKQFKQRVETETYSGDRKEHGGGNPIADAGW